MFYYSQKVLMHRLLSLRPEYKTFDYSKFLLLRPNNYLISYLENIVD